MKLLADRYVSANLSSPHTFFACQLWFFSFLKVTQSGDAGFVGCYDGGLYCFGLLTGYLCWHFASKAMIKCRPLICGDNVVFGNYGEDANLWSVNAQSGHLNWATKIGSSGISANPGRLDDGDIIVCTLNGTTARVCSKDGTIKWSTRMETAIFASPTVTSSSTILVCEVTGTVRCLSAVDGQRLWEFNADGNIFSSLALIDGQRYGTFGCYDRFAYCLRMSDGQLMWRCNVGGQVRAVPRQFGDSSSLLICTTNGWMRLIDWRTGNVQRSAKVGGDIFSTPAVEADGRVYVGSRNDNLYCFDLSGWLVDI